MRRSTLWLVLCSASGCVYSPPIRGLHAGMPDRVGRAQLEVGGTVGGWSAGIGFYVTPPTTGGPHVAYGLSDTLVLEAGANLNFVEGLWATTWAGVRMVRSKDLGDEVHLVGDLEVGGGIGLGGRTGFSQHEREPWTSHAAYGLYEGAGVGLRWRWLGGFLRGRLDASANSAAPATLWPTVMLGLEAKPGNHVVFAMGTGWGGFWQPAKGFVGLWFYQAQVAFLFDLVPVNSRP